MEKETEQAGQSNSQPESSITDHITKCIMPQYHALFRGWKKLMEKKYNKTDNLLSKIGIELAEMDPTCDF